MGFAPGIPIFEIKRVPFSGKTSSYELLGVKHGGPVHLYMFRTITRNMTPKRFRFRLAL